MGPTGVRDVLVEENGRKRRVRKEGILVAITTAKKAKKKVRNVKEKGSLSGVWILNTA
jgi:hypothetical protein